MATSMVASRFLMEGRRSLVRRLQRVDTYVHRHVRTNAAPARSKVCREEENVPGEKSGHKSLLAVQVERQEQAERSVLIHWKSTTSETTFLKYLSRHGAVKNHFFYESDGIYALVEFVNSESVASLSEDAVDPSISSEAIVPFKSRLLSLRDFNSTQSSPGWLGQKLKPQTSIPINELIPKLSRQESIDQQIMYLTEAFQLTEENIRLRFLVCSLLKDVAGAFFPESTLRPFGSSVNGFGKLGCDLDMTLDPNGVNERKAKTPISHLFLEFQMKSANSERAITQSFLATIGDCLDQFWPGCARVQKILNARCPLIRFTHQPSGFQCDLTVSNRVAIKSTELLYLYGQLDPRVRPLVFVVRCWAQVHGITRQIPGAWITNFSLTVMVLFFLQRMSPPIIPTLDHLKNLAGPSDKSVIEGIDCTFVSDLSRIPLQSNTETPGDLLCQFFDFYSTFSFSKMSINIRKGKEQHKPDCSPLYIQNPFETSQNVSKNVNAPQLDRFVALCQESAWLLQQNETAEPRRGTKKNISSAWGLGNLFQPSKVAAISRKKKRVGDRIKKLLENLNSSKPEKS